MKSGSKVQKHFMVLALTSKYTNNIKSIVKSGDFQAFKGV